MRNWCFTSFKVDSFPELSSQHVKYCVYQREICPETGKEHLQGYIELTKSMRMNAVKCMLEDDTLHLERRKGTRNQCRDYCMKEETRKEGTSPVEFGTFKSTQGQRTDLLQVYSAIKEGQDLNFIIDEYPGVYLRYYRSIERLIGRQKAQKEYEDFAGSFSDVTLKPWQTTVISRLDAQTDREVLWVVDKIGGKGKTFLSKYLVVKHNALIVTGGKTPDISYLYNFQKIVVFDLARKTEFLPFQLIENLKNGVIFSPKYESHVKYSPNVKVVVFSNEDPDQSRLSLDRWNILTL